MPPSLRAILVLLLVIASHHLPLVAVVSAQGAGGSIKGVVQVRERENGEGSLLIGFETNTPAGTPADGAPPVHSQIDRFRVRLPDDYSLKPSSLPPNWTLTVDGKLLEVTGPPIDLPAYFRFDTPDGDEFCRRLLRDKSRLEAFFDEVPMFQSNAVAELRPRVQLQTTLENALTLPPQVTEGEPFFGTPQPQYRLGTWRTRIGPGAMTPEDPAVTVEADALFQRTFSSPQRSYDAVEIYLNRVFAEKMKDNLAAGIAPGQSVHFGYFDQWGELLVQGPAEWTINRKDDGPAPEASCPPSISGGSPLTFAGQNACVTGCFSGADAELGKALGLLLDGKTPLEFEAGSPTTMVLRLPEDVPAGPHSIEWGPWVTHATGRLQFGVLQLQGSIDQQKLWRGQGTTMRLRILGSEESLPLVVINRTPKVIQVEGGERQVIPTPGGADNGVTRTVRGIMRGDFQVDYRLEAPPCGLTPPAGSAR